MEFFKRMFGLGSPTPPGYNGQYYGDYSPYEEDDSRYTPGGHPFDNPDMMHSMQHMEHMMNMVDQMLSGLVFVEPGMNPFNGQLNIPHNSEDQLQNGPQHLAPSSPRDQLLKRPDSAPDGDGDLGVHNRYPSSPQEQDSQDFQHHNHSLQDRHPGSIFSAFSMLDQFIGSLGRSDPFIWSHSAGDNHLEDQDPSSARQTPRDTLIKKEDLDLDQQTGSSDISALLKDGPGYTYGGRRGSPSSDDVTKPGPLLPFQEPTVRRTFTSTSIQRIVKPDGSIEERRTYRDSSGKEEVTITQMDPQTAGPLLPHDGDPFSSSGGLGSILGSLFR